MRKLSIRGRGDGVYEIGPASSGRTDRTVIVQARDKHLALVEGKKKWRERFKPEGDSGGGFRNLPEKGDRS